MSNTVSRFLVSNPLAAAVNSSEQLPVTDTKGRRINDVLLCLTTGILHGLSWPILPDVNLSFLAWFAFVPLFILLERHQHSF
ncbi:MAG: hypothetical protein ACI81P_002320 [Neolewinella sp.]|jgi:hypothetical protein